MSHRKMRTPEIRARSGTPNLNSTVAGTGGSASGARRGLLGSTSSARCLDVTKPRLKSTAFNSAPAIDWNLECDFAYGDYLQAVMKESIINEFIETHEQDIKDQLAIQTDRLHKMEESLETTKGQVTCLEVSKQIEELINASQKCVEEFNKVAKEHDLEAILKELRDILEQACDLIILKNIKPISDEESYKKLCADMKKVVSVINKFKSSGRDIEGVNNLADVIQQFKNVAVSVENKIQDNVESQESVSFEFAKTISDMYATQAK